MYSENLAKIHVIETTVVSYSWCRLAKNAGGKNEGKFHYVIENTCRKNVSFMAFHDVIENTGVIVLFPLC